MIDSIWLRALMAALLAVLPVLLPAGCVLTALTGCSAHWWGGEDTGRTPGVHVIAPSLFNPGEISVTSQLQARISKLKYVGGTKDTPASFELEGDFGQDVASVIREQPAKLDAIARVQHEQAVYWEAMGKAVASWISEIAPIFNVMALAKIRTVDQGLQLTLPGGFSVGSKRIETPADLEGLIQSVISSTEKARASFEAGAPTTQPQGHD